ncbi:fasciclin domain-containing protein [Parabacteroides sp. FAFU027]|uniref:fasciclin domain-containing protein n=1 Tax=Parabacteroides sp. FAFU027 TaxID=2922715 RepID=UPI001FAF467D|nr:fasciclin domain-containing protein [Parabacteroides sp. FAFU027]
MSVLLSLLAISCSNKDDYYDRPDWLEAPVYDILKEKGNFSLYLECIDKTPYAKVLKGAGNYTVFAPNDNAFKAFMQKNNYATVADIPVDELKKIVGYTMIYNKYDSNTLGGIAGEYIKRRTSYYKTIYQEKVNGVDSWVADLSTTTGNIMTPFRFIPVLTSKYFRTNSLGDGRADYAHFYPNASFDSIRIQNAGVVEKDIYAENGIIHVLDSVPYVLKNIDELLKENKDGFSSMKNLLDFSYDGTSYYVQYQESNTLTEEYKKLYPEKNITNLYAKFYTGLPFQPNQELYGSSSGSTLGVEQGGYTMIVPSKQAIDNYFSTKILNRGYKTLNELPKEVITDFLQAHMKDELIWPSGYATGQNANGEFLNGEGSRGKTFDQAGVVSSTLASNGILYQTNDVVKSKYFETVFSEILLNPNYQLLNYAMKKFYFSTLMEDLMKSPLTGYIEENYTIILPTDDQLKADGFSYDNVANTFSNRYIANGAEDRLKRIIRMGIFRRIKNSELNTSLPEFVTSKIPTQYDGYGYAVNEYGDVIRYKNNQVQGVGNFLDNKDFVTLTKVGEFNNGVVYKGDKLLQYSPRTTQPSANAGWNDESLYNFVARYVKTTGQGKIFLSYMTRALLNTTDGKLTGIPEGNYYTILIPTDAILNQAKNAIINKFGIVLPDTSSVVATNPTAFRTAQEFVQSCFLSGTVLPDDGEKYIIPSTPANTREMTLSTMMRANAPELGLLQEKTYMTIKKNDDLTMTFIPKDITLGDKTLVDGGIGITKIDQTVTINRTRLNVNTPYYSNFMGPRAVIHAVNNYPWFKIVK